MDQDEARKDLGLKIKNGDSLDLAPIATKLFKRVKGSSFKKTNFALALMHQKKEDWVVPHYIDEGLKWLVGKILPPVETSEQSDVAFAPVDLKMEEES